MGRLDGKVALITGAGSGMGAAIAERFVREGARVVAADISGQQKDVAAAIGDNCLPFQADVSKGQDVQAMLKAAVDTFGKLDVLCNNAGIDGKVALTADHSEEEFDRVFAVNGRAVFLGLHYGIPLMLDNGGGSIINTSSVASTVAFPGMPGYCAAKGAVDMLTKTAAVEYASQRIRVNAILPGPIRTAITDSLPKELMEGVMNATPIGRYGSPSEIASLALYLASDESEFVTGSTIAIDGGYLSI